MAHIYLRKANDDYVSHCKCPKDDALISFPGQADCPWCGCGWLFGCSKCRKAFTFAEGVEVDDSWQAIAERDLLGFSGRQPKPREVVEWIYFMKSLLVGVVPGRQYVYLDGHMIPMTAEGLTIDGWYARHELPFVPQVAAMSRPEVRSDILSSVDYWQTNRLPPS